MPGVDEIQPEVVRIPELVIAHVRRDERVTSRRHRLQHLVGAAPAAHGNAADGLAAVHIAQAGAAEGPLDRLQEFRQRLLVGLAAAQQPPRAALGVRSARVEHRDIPQAQHGGQLVVHAAGGAVEVRVRVDGADARRAQPLDDPADARLVRDVRHGAENERVMCDDDVRAPFDRLIADVLERVEGNKDLLDLLFAAAAEQADVVPVHFHAVRRKGLEHIQNISNRCHKAPSFRAAPAAQFHNSAGVPARCRAAGPRRCAPATG